MEKRKEVKKRERQSATITAMVHRKEKEVGYRLELRHLGINTIFRYYLELLM